MGQPHGTGLPIMLSSSKAEGAMRLSGIPIIQPVPLITDPCGPMGSPQPIMQLKELAVDQVRYQEWKASLKRERREKPQGH
jgi:hypothetical protein